MVVVLVLCGVRFSFVLDVSDCFDSSHTLQPDHRQRTPPGPRQGPCASLVFLCFSWGLVFPLPCFFGGAAGPAGADGRRRLAGRRAGRRAGAGHVAARAAGGRSIRAGRVVAGGRRCWPGRGEPSPERSREGPISIDEPSARPTGRRGRRAGHGDVAGAGRPPSAGQPSARPRPLSSVWWATVFYVFFMCFSYVFNVF